MARCGQSETSRELCGVDRIQSPDDLPHIGRHDTLGIEPALGAMRPG